MLRKDNMQNNKQSSKAKSDNARKRIVKLPDDPASVGWTTPKYFFLCRENGDEPFKLECGVSLKDVVIEYETYGTLNADKSNAILIAHAYTGDAHVAGWDSTASETFRPWRLKEPGWWDSVVGPGQAFDTSKFFVICANCIGSCYGSTGPASPNPDNGGKPYGGHFPDVTTNDWLRTQMALLKHLGISKLYAVAGGSMGGHLPLEMAMGYPDMVERCIILASDVRQSAQTLGFNYIFRSTIQNDPAYKGGKIYSDEREKNPILKAAMKAAGITNDLTQYSVKDRRQRGLYAARMLAVITYLSSKHLQKKFEHKYQPARGSWVEERKAKPGEVELAVQAYLNHLCEKFLGRFDANSFIIISKALDQYDVQEKWGHGNLREAAARIKAKVMVITFSSDWLYPPELAKAFVKALQKNGQDVTAMHIRSNYGHDAFLEETDTFQAELKKFLE